MEISEKINDKFQPVGEEKVMNLQLRNDFVA